MVNAKIFIAVLISLFLSMTLEAQLPYPFFDDVENDSLSNSYWKPDSATWSIVRLIAHSGTGAWKCSPTSGNYAWLTLKKEINLSQALNPGFSLWITQLATGDAARGFYKVQISTDNGTSWSDIIGETATSGLLPWTQLTASLERYKGLKILIRIGVRDHTGYAGTPTYYIDDIVIDDAPVPTYVRLSDATNNGMKISWGQSSASDFYRYRLVISTDANDVNNWVDGSYVSGRKERRVIDIFNKATVETTLTDLVFTNTVYYVKLYEQDTIGFMNAGTSVAQLSTAFNTGVEVAPFTQDFEGAVNWAWDLPWGIVSDDSSTPGHSYKNVITDSPGGVYPANADRRLYAKISFGTVLSPVLYFNHRYSFETDADWGNVYFTPDLQNYYRIGYFTGVQGDYKRVEFDMRPFKGVSSGGWLVFQVISNSSNNYDGWYIDDVGIYNITGFTGLPLFDSFSDTTSLDRWILGMWRYEYGLWIKTTPKTGDWSYIVLRRPLDLSKSANPYLSFKIKKVGGGYAYYTVDVSVDGGYSWYNLLTSGRDWGDFDWRRVDVSLLNYKGKNVLIRIGVRHDRDWFSTYYIDDIVIDDAPVPTYVRLSDATNNGMKISWGQSSASDFYRYRLVISTDANDVNNWVDGSYVSGRKERRVIDIFNKATVETTLTDLVFTNTVYYVKLYEQDTIGFMNAGTSVAQLSTAFNTGVEVAPFTQDFEGAVNWAWDLPWGIVSDDSSTPGHSYKNVITDSPGGVYPANADRRLYAKISFGTVLSPVLYFNHRYSFETDADWGNVYFTPDLQNYYRIGYFTGVQGDYKRVEFDMRPFKGVSSGGWLVFQVISNSSNNYDGWYIDDVGIYNITGFTGLPLFDSFSDTTSLDRWILGMWRYEYGLWIKTTPKTGDWSYIVLRRPLDLSKSANPYLSFKIKKVGGGYAYYTVDVSVDGGYSWYNLLTSGRDWGDFDWRRVDVSLLNYKGKNVLIRIGVRHDRDWFSTYYIDDIAINEYIGAPTLVAPLNRATGLDIPVTFSWTSILGAFRYQIQISTDSLFSTLIVNDSTLTKTQYIASTLKPNTTYYWRVRAMDSLYTGPWSSVYKFTTRIAQVASFSIPLSKGWNMISSYVIPDNITLDSVLSKVRSNLRLLKDGFGNVYWPDLNIDQIKNWNVKLGYQVNMKTSDTLKITGYKVTPENSPVYLLKGWNLIAYLRDQPMSIDSALSTIANYIVIVKDNSGKVYWPRYAVNQIGSMNPGQGYQIYVTQACTLTYPANYSTSPHVISAKTQPDEFTQKPKFYRNSAFGTGNNAILLIQSNNFEDGDEIAILAVKSNMVVGSAVVSDKKAILTVWGDDITTQEKDGAEEGETLKLLYYSAKLNKEIPLTVKNITDPLTGEVIYDVLKYKADAVLIVEAEISNIIPNSYVLEQNYPNPFNPYTTIKYGLPEDSKITIEVFDILGRKVAVLVDKYQKAGFYEVIFYADELPSGMYIYRMIANGSIIASKKMLLVK
jgi:hypothetical protein